MKIAGVIAEYNPFHLGHEYHLRETRKRSGCDYIVVCMVGSFTQRGEETCLDKWSRVRAALLCGADAVFELPALWAVRTADAFARGGVAILSGLDCDVLSFGCEFADMDLLRQLADLGEAEPPEISSAIRRGMAEGESHARARGEAMAAYLGVNPALLHAPNCILALEYLRSLHALSSRMQPLLLRRKGSHHPSDELPIQPSGVGEGHPPAATGADAVYASASAIRAALASGDRAFALAHVPENTRSLLAAAPAMHAPDDLLLFRLRNMDEAELGALPDLGEGLQHRLGRCAREASSRADLLDRLKCKRYTLARLSRLCTHVLLGMTAELCASHPLPEYARLLGMREEARPLLRELARRSTLPIVSDPTRMRNDPVFRLECRATDLRALCCDVPAERRAGRDFTHKFVLLPSTQKECG